MTPMEQEEWVPVQIAARELGITPLNILMHLKHQRLEGRETLDGWRVSVRRLERFRHRQDGGDARHICRGHACTGCGAHGTGPRRVERRILIAPGDLRFKYKRHRVAAAPRFTGPPDARPFDRTDLHEVQPMLEAVMTELQTDDGRVLLRLEEILNGDLPQSINTREEVYAVLVNCMRDILQG